METISVALVCTLIGTIISYLVFQRNKNNDIRANSREEAKTEAKLDYIATAVDEIRIDNKARDREIKDIRERVIIMEASSKSAHKRIDTVEEEIKKCLI